MSIHHEVSIHCDGCGTWEHGNDRTTPQRRKAGWLIEQINGHWRHVCPACAATGAKPADYY